MLVRTLNDGVKGGSVKFSYDPVTQKVCVHMKGDTTFMLYGDLPDILGFGRGDGVVIRTSNRRTLTQGDSIIDLRRGFESLYVYSSIVETRIVGDKIAPLLRIVPISGRHGEMVTARFDHVQYMPVLSREFGSIETEIRDDTGRPVPFERGKVTVHFTIDGAALGYSDELRRLLCKAGGWGTALLYRRSCPERGRVWSLFSGLLLSVAPLIRRGAVALGKRALTTGVQIASVVVAGQNVKKAAKRRTTDAGRDLMESLLNTPPPPGKRVKRIKRAAPRRRVISNKRRPRSDVFS